MNEEMILVPRKSYESSVAEDSGDRDSAPVLSTEPERKLLMCNPVM